MAYSTAGGDHLHVSRSNLAPTTGTIFVLEHAFAHVRDDLHVAMPVHGKAAVRGYLVVVPDHEVSEPCMRGVALGFDSKVVPGFEPVAISTSQGVQSSQLQHRSHLAGSNWWCSPRPTPGEANVATDLYLDLNLEKTVVVHRIMRPTVREADLPWMPSKT